MTTEIVILAAGQGSRMKSALPKVLHPLAAKPLVQHVIDSAKALQPEKIHLVIGHGGDKVRQHFADEALQWGEQKEQLGTGHAVAQVIDAVDESAAVLVLYGDVPLTPVSTLQLMLTKAQQNALVLLTTKLDNPRGYGRIVRDEDSQVVAIVEEKDASESQRKIQEINSGIMAMPAKALKSWLPRLSADNAQAEYYLTDIVAMSVDDNVTVDTVNAERFEDVQGVNNRQQLAQLERYYQQQQAQLLMENGVTLADPSRIDIRGSIRVGKDSFIDVNCIFEGDVDIAEQVEIGANCIIKNAVIAAGTKVKPFSHIEDAIIDSGCDIGPYARLRPGSKLSQNAKVGNFVEIKKATLGEGSKVNHLSYIGDATLGKDVNVGAGTITCNYDGANKHHTEIGDGVFVGSNSALVAPIKVGDNVTIGAGSTLSKNVESDCLVVARGKTRVIDGWQRPTKKK